MTYKKFLRLLQTLLLIILPIEANSQLLYRVTSPANGRTSYIFGTHHLAPLKILNDIPELQTALDDAETIVGEIDMTGGQLQMAMSLQKYMIAPSDSTLNKLLSDEDYEEAKRRFSELTGGVIGLDMLSGMKPMVAQSFVTLTIMKEDIPGYQEGEQLDQYFQTEAKEFGKRVVGLETVEEQAKYLYDGLSLTEQAADLLDILRNPEELKTQLELVNKAYQSQDLLTLLELSQEQEKDEKSRKFMNKLLTERNFNWLKILPEMMERENLFVAVGALHLPGENGLLKGLENMGYKIEGLK